VPTLPMKMLGTNTFALEPSARVTTAVVLGRPEAALLLSLQGSSLEAS
jgi:hypothetical protein